MKHFKARSTMLSLLMVVVLLLSASGAACADEPSLVSLYIDDKCIEFPEGEGAVILNGRTLVPARYISELLGAKVEWNPAASQVIIKNGTKTIILTIGSKEISIDGQTSAIDAPPVIIKGRTLVPLRFVSEALGLKAEWKNNAAHVITDGKVTVRPIPKPAVKPSIPLVTKPTVKPAYTMPIPLEFIKIGEMVEGAEVTESGNVGYFSPTVPKNPNFIIYHVNIYDEGDKYMIFIKPWRDDNTQMAVKEMLKVFYPIQYENAYQDFLSVMDAKGETSVKTYDGRTFQAINVLADIRFIIGKK